MVAVQKLDESMFDDIYRDFLIDDDPDLTRADWQRLFATREDTGQNCGGYALVDGSRIGGILGMLFSQRYLDDRVHNFCSLHTWMVKPEYRGSSLRLMRPALKLTDHTVCDFTPTTPVRALSRRLGFRDLDSSLRVLFPVPGVKSAVEKFEFLDDEKQICSQLPAEHRQLFDDHRAEHFGHLLFSVGSSQCYIIYSRVNRWRVPYIHVHFVSDMRQFSEHSVQLRTYIGRSEKTHIVVLNERQTRNMHFPFSFRFAFTNGQLCRPAAAAPPHIDSLYSDVAQLNLTTINDLTHAVKEKLRLV